MGVWDAYAERIKVRGMTKRETHLTRETRNIDRRLPHSLSYTTAVIYDTAHCYNIESDEMQQHAVTQDVAIINSDNLNEKTIIAMPGDTIESGSLVFWMDQYWVVTEQDANETLYLKSKMIQCNHLLKWINAEDEVIMQWCVVEDGTKYLTGDYEDRDFITTRGDSRIAITVARNKETVRLGRKNRFLIDDPDSPDPLAYTLSKPLKFAGTYQKHGVYKFVLHEVNTTDNDNTQLGIADYYKHFPRTDETVEPPAKPDGSKTERRNWL